MTDRLQEIRERHDAIIPGPWDWFGNTATDQVFLGTPDRGRLFIIQPGLRHEQSVYDERNVESYTLAQARANVTNWCPAHSDPDETDFPPPCLCDELREFLRGDMDPMEGYRRFETWLRLERGDVPDRVPSLIRSVSVHHDLLFVGEGNDAFGGRKQQGGVQRSYRETGVRYEVLGYRTRTEWEKDGTKPVEHALYREDFRGIDSPEAEFIAAAPQDTDYLLKRLTAAEEHIEALQQLCMWENRGQALQGTVDARALAATTLACWEGNQ